MLDFSLVPVDYQPNFGDYSLVPVDYDPFAGDDASRPAQFQPTQGLSAQVQGQPTQAQPTQLQAQSPLQPVSPAQPQPAVPGSGSSSPFVDFFNQLADPERAQAERVADLVQNHPTAAKVVGAINLGSLLLPPLAIAGAEGLGLFGAGAGGSAVADGLAGPAISGAGRAATTAARQSIDEAVATLPKGISRQKFGELAGFANSLPASSQASTEATAEIISGLKEAGITSRSIAAFQKFYEGAARETPSNLSAAHRAALLANILKSFQ